MRVLGAKTYIYKLVKMTRIAFTKVNLITYRGSTTRNVSLNVSLVKSYHKIFELKQSDASRPFKHL